MPERLLDRSIKKIDLYLKKPNTKIARALHRLAPEQGVSYRNSRKKRIVDRSLAITLVAPTVPIIGVLAVAKKIEDRGPAFYRSPRIGRDGVVFNVIKIRTLEVDADKKKNANKANTVTPGKPYDQRATPLGQWMRRLRLDETPQILQAAFGRRMSLIGMRADTQATWEAIREQFPKTAGESYEQYTLSKPASFNPHAVFYRQGTLAERERYNTHYAQHASLGLDLYIFYKAIMRILLEKSKQKV